MAKKMKVRLAIAIEGSPLLTVVAKAVLDTQFRAALIQDAAQAIQDAGLPALSRQELAELSNLNPAGWDNLTWTQLDARLSAIRGPSVTSCVAIA